MRILARGQIHDTQCWSPGGEWVVFDNRQAGMDIRHATRIAKVHIETGEIVPLYEVQEAFEDGPGVGAATFSPDGTKVLFIHGIRPYSFHSRFGMLVHADGSGVIGKLDRPPLNGGTHAHTWHPNGQWVSCTYNDAVNVELPRTVAVLTPESSFLVAHPVMAAAPGSDDFEKALDECWVGDQPMIAFQGITRDRDGEPVTEIFLADLLSGESQPPSPRSSGLPPFKEEEWSGLPPHPSPLPLGSGGEGAQNPPPWGGGGEERAGGGVPSNMQPRPLSSQDSDFPLPNEGDFKITVRRLTHSKGIRGVRHWLRSMPAGDWIACLMEDARGISQIHLVNTADGQIWQLTQNDHPVDSPFNFIHGGGKIAYSSGNRICITDLQSGETERLGLGEKPINGVACVGPNDDQFVTNRIINGEQVITIESG